MHGHWFDFSWPPLPEGWTRETLGALLDRLASEIEGGAQSVAVTSEEFRTLRYALGTNAPQMTYEAARFYGIPILVDDRLPPRSVVFVGRNGEAQFADFTSGGEGDA